MPQMSPGRMMRPRARRRRGCGGRAGRIFRRSGRLDREGDDVPLLPAELHPDQVDGPTEIPVPVRVAPLPDPGQREALRLPVRQFELEHVYVGVERHGHVRPAPAAALPDPHIHARGREVRVEHARIMRLVPRHARPRVPFVRDARGERAERSLDAREVVRPQKAAQVPPFRNRRELRRHRPEQDRVQAAPHLVVRIAQRIDGSVPVPLLARDGQVAGPEQQRLGFDAVHVEGRQQRIVGHAPLERQGVDPAPGQQVSKKCRRAGLAPVAPELPRVEQQQDVERVVDLPGGRTSCSRCTNAGSRPVRDSRARARTPCRAPSVLIH